MAAALGELWRYWAEGPGVTLLTVALVGLSLFWITGAGLTFATARMTGRPGGLYALPVLLPTLLVAAVGISRPRAFHLWSLAGLAIGALIGGALTLLVRRSTNRCPQGHVLAPGWKFCPVCPSPLPMTPAVPAPVFTRHTSGGVATVVRPVGLPIPSGPVGPAPAPAPASFQADILVWLVPERPGGPHVAVRRPGATVGRDPTLEIFIDDPSVSWEHAQIVSRDGVPALVDAGSSNGTWVNGERVHESLLLSDDRVTFGDSAFRVVRP